MTNLHLFLKLCTYTYIYIHLHTACIYTCPEKEGILTHTYVLNKCIEICSAEQSDSHINGSYTGSRVELVAQKK